MRTRDLVGTARHRREQIDETSHLLQHSDGGGSDPPAMGEGPVALSRPIVYMQKVLMKTTRTGQIYYHVN
jgi:hypothetical protein